MQRLAPLAAAFSLAGMLALGGCVFFTPSTGLRLGDHTNEYAQTAGNGSGLSTQMALLYKDKDFAIPYPSAWEPQTGIDQIEDLNNTLVARVLIAGAAGTTAAGATEVEGLQVHTYMRPLDPDPTKNLQDLAGVGLQLIQSTLKSGGTLVSHGTVTIDGESGLVYEVSGTLADDTSSTGAVIAGYPVHLLGACCWHLGHGYLVELQTTEDRFAASEQLFETIIANMLFSNVPVQLCPVSAANAATGAASTQPATAAAAVKSRLFALTASPVPAATAAASPSNSATAAVAASAGAFAVCFPSVAPAATGAATPGATAAASPAH